MSGLTSANLHATIVSHKEIELNITLPEDLTCLVTKGRLNATICHAPQNGNECSETEPKCEDVMVSGVPMLFKNLSPNTTYCFEVTLSSVNSSQTLNRQIKTKSIATGTSLSLKPKPDLHTIHHSHTVQHAVATF